MSRPFRILQITDTHLLADPDQLYSGWRVSQSLKHVVGHIHHTGINPDAVLLTGDLAQDEHPDSYRLLRQHLEPLSAPLWALPGNHDDPEVLQQYLKPDLYLDYTDLPGWRVILLNSHEQGETAGRLSAAELERLEKLLLSCHTPCLVVVHHPAWKVNSVWLDAIGMTNGEALLGILDEHPEVKMLLCGHIHQHFDEWRGSIRQLGTPSTCRQFLPGSENFSEDAQAPGYRWLDLYPEGRFLTHIERVPDARSAKG